VAGSPRSQRAQTLILAQAWAIDARKQTVVAIGSVGVVCAHLACGHYTTFSILHVLYWNSLVTGMKCFDSGSKILKSTAHVCSNGANEGDMQCCAVSVETQGAPSNYK